LDSLDGGGFFIIGSHERLPFQTYTLSSFKGSPYIFQKTKAPLRTLPRYN
jgi:hypothetical protein